MKKSLLLIIFALLSTSTLSAWEFFKELKVGKRPVGIFETDVRWDKYQGLLVICAGYDQNEDGKQDPGDEPASIWYMPYYIIILSAFDLDTTYVNVSTPFKLIDLDFRNEVLPLRPAVVNDKIYISGLKGVYEISIIDGDTIKAEKKVILDLIPTAISHGYSRWNSNLLYLSMKPNTTEPGSVIIYDLDSKKYYDTIPSYPNVQMTLPIENKQVLILSEGIPGQNNSRLQIADISGTIGPEDIYLVLDSTIGDGANHLARTDNYSNNFNIITCYGSSNVVFLGKGWTQNFNLDKDEGPRETFVSPYSGIMTSCYNGYIYLFDYNPIIYDSLKAYGRAEGLYSNSNILAIATPYLEGTFEPDSTVTIYLKPILNPGVKETDDEIRFFFDRNSNTMKLFSNNIPDKIQVFTINGEKLLETENSNSISLNGIASGIYFVKTNLNYREYVNKIIVY